VNSGVAEFSDGGGHPPLNLPGIDASTEVVYLSILMGGRTPADEVAARFRLELDDAVAQLETLRGAGLLTRLEGPEPDYAAVDPRFAIRGLVDRLSDRAARLSEAIPVLAEQFEASLPRNGETPQTVVVSGADAVAAWYARLQHHAAREILAFDRPPYVAASFDPFQSAVLARGVVWKVIYTIESFEGGATWEEVDRLAEQGEQARITRDLPVKLVVVDDEIAMISLSLEPGQAEALVTHSEPVVAAFRKLFEFEWERAVPIAQVSPLPDSTSTGRGFPATPGREPSGQERAILTLMAVGMKDEAIARQLGVSARTLRRRSQELLAELGAGNRFAAGVEAARRGWLEHPV